MRALIFKGLVVELKDQDFPVAQGLKWMDAPPGCEVGWVLNGDVLEPPTITPMSDAEKVKTELPTYDERIDALWDAIVKADNTKALAMEVRIQAVYDKYNVPRG